MYVYVSKTDIIIRLVIVFSWILVGIIHLIDKHINNKHK